MDDKEVARDNSSNKKKMLHREIERQRRQEMSRFCTSLRSLLPLEFVKGKRSMSDHMHAAVNYIKHLEKKIEELSAQRDDLKKLTNSQTAGSSKTYCESSSISVRPCLGGIEVMIVSGLREQDLPLSRVLQVLLEEGSAVVNCVTTKVNSTLLHTVQIEVNDPTCLNLFELQQKLTSAIAS